MNDIELIWESYKQIHLKEDFDDSEIENLSQFLMKYHPEARIVLTNKETIENVNVNQVSRKQKPNGIWYSLANEWVDYLKYDAPEMAPNYTNAFSLDIDYTKVLKIDSPEKFLEFHKKYSDGMFVDWKAIQNEGYCGVEIIPFQSEYKFDVQWYYIWDIASGCIWDSSCIKKSTKVYPTA
jgi:hypothetical protein